MANELKLSAAIRFTKLVGGTLVDVYRNYLNLTYTISGNDYAFATQTIATAETALDLGSCAAGGYLLIKNIDTANFVRLRRATGEAATIRINAGEIALFRLDSVSAAAPYLIADTSPVVVEYGLVEP